MSICFDSPCFSTELKSLNDILSDPAQFRVRVSFWGGRVVTIGDHSILLNDLVNKIHCTSFKCIRGTDLSQESRLAGVSLLPKLEQLYATTDLLIKHTNWFTQLLVKIREITCCGRPKTREFLKNDSIISECFRTYKGQRFGELYGSVLDNSSQSNTNFPLHRYSLDLFIVKKSVFLDPSTAIR